MTALIAFLIGILERGGRPRAHYVMYGGKRLDVIDGWPEDAARRQRERRTAANAAVDDAIWFRKVAPSGRAWAEAYAEKDPEGFREFVASAPIICVFANGRALIRDATPNPAPRHRGRWSSEN